MTNDVRHGLLRLIEQIDEALSVARDRLGIRPSVLRVMLGEQLFAQTAHFQWQWHTTTTLRGLMIEASGEPPLFVWRWRWTAAILRFVGKEPPAATPSLVLELVAGGRLCLAQHLGDWDRAARTFVVLAIPILIPPRTPVQIRVRNARNDDQLWIARVGIDAIAFDERTPP